MMTSQGRNDELKEWLARRWESSDTDPPTSSVGTLVTTAGVKRKASSVLETPADSTEDVLTSTSRSSSGRRGSTSKVTKNNILLASLLATRASAEQPVVNTLSIGSIATVTPQSNLMKKAPADQLNSLVNDAVAASGTARRFSSSSLSSVTSVSTAEDTSGTSSSTVTKSSRVFRSYSETGSRGLNPILTEANLSCQDASVDTKNDVPSQDQLPTDIMESMCDVSATSNVPSLMDDATLFSQIEQLFSSPGELESLLGDGYAELTSSLFGSDAPDLGGQVSVTSVDMLGSQSQQVPISRTCGTGLLGQLLVSGPDQHTTDSSFTVTSEMLLPQRPNSLAMSSTYFQRGGMYNRTSLHCHS